MADRPNLLFAFADQLRRQSCGFTEPYPGDPEPQTPSIDALAAEGADVEHAVSSTPICAPTRASLFAGRYASSTGMVMNELRTMPDPTAIAHVLNDAGYRTAYVGKWHLWGTENDDATEHQFVPPGPFRLGFEDDWWAYNMNHDYYAGYHFGDEPERRPAEGYLPGATTDLAIDCLERGVADDRPFALFVSWGPPHDPFEWSNCPDRFARGFRDADVGDPPTYAPGHARYWHPRMDEAYVEREFAAHRDRMRRVYHALTASVDHELGRLLDALDRLDAAADTATVFTSDHGEMFGAHGRMAKNVFYEEAIRVPFLLRYPGAVAPGVRSVPFDTADVAPTLLGLLGVDVPDAMEGRDLSGVLRGPQGPPAGSSGDELVDPATSTHDPAFLQGMGHTYVWHDGNEYRGARDERYTYARWRGGEELLFDNRSDPYQRENLIDDPGDDGAGAARERLRSFVDERIDALDDPFAPTTWYRDRWVVDRHVVRSATRELPGEYRPDAGRR